VLLALLPRAHADEAAFAPALTALGTAEDFSAKSAAIDAIVASRHPRAQAAMTALLDGNLYLRAADQRVFVIGEGEPAPLTDALTGAAAGTAPADSLTKITTNNSLRRALRGHIALFALSHPDATARLDAVEEMLRSPDEETIARLTERLAIEKDDAVRESIARGISLADLASADPEKRLRAIESLQGSLNLELQTRLVAMTTADAAGAWPEPDERVRVAARELAASIDSKRRFYSTVETLFFGLSLGSVLVLAAIGLAITFGVMGVINMAHGELMMLGAYTTFFVQQAMPNHIGVSVLVAVPLAFLVSGSVGVLIERGIVRFLYGRPLDTLLATFGVSLLLQQAVRSYKANNVPVETPAWMTGPIQINDALAITWNRLTVFIFALLVFAALLVVLKRTSLGLKVRAVAQNRSMARAMGVRTEWVDALTFGLGSGIAGVAGVALSQITNVGPNLGQTHIIDSFMVVVFGGVGNLWGTLIGGSSLGLVNKTLEPWVGSVLAQIFVLVALILFIQRKPKGLFPQKGRAAD
jgi:urea transport system permease protein